MFSVLDGLRMLGGLLVLNALCSYWFTSSTTWGYNGRGLDPHFWAHRVFSQPVNLTIAELAQYNGKTRSRIFIALNGTVFDVTRSAQIYSAETGSYRQLVGRDSSRVFVTGCLGKPDEYTHDLRELDPALVDKNLALWLDYYRNHKNYWEVGTVQLETPDPDTTPPASCEHARRPGH